MAELRELVRTALTNALENDYLQWLRETPTAQIAVDLADKDATIEEYVTSHSDDGPKFVDKTIVPLVDEWLNEHEIRST